MLALINMDYTKEIVDSIKPILNEYGFKKKGLNWFSENDNIVKIFNIQKSQFGKQIYLNIGIKIKALESKISNTFPGSQVGFSLDHLLSAGVLDFENNLDSKMRCEEMIKLLSNNPYGFFTLTGSIESIKKFIKDTGSITMVFLVAKNYLGLDQ